MSIQRSESPGLAPGPEKGTSLRPEMDKHFRRYSRGDRQDYFSCASQTFEWHRVNIKTSARKIFQNGCSDFRRR